MWRLCCVGVHGFGRLVVVICMVCVFVLIVYIGRFSSWLECCMVLWMGCSMGGG